MVDYSIKIEKLLKEMRTLLQPAGQQPLAPATTLVAQLEESATPTGRPDPMLQEAISNINTEDIASLEQWAVGGLQDMTTLTSRS